VGKRLINPNQETTLELPSSEVCLHLGVAGTRMRARLQLDGMVQLLDPAGRDVSFPITAAEAGLQHGRSWMPSASRWPSPTGTPGAARCSTTPPARCPGIQTSAT
jgi:hypothetical protein